MRERINRLAKGIVDPEQRKLLIEPAAVQETIRAGEIMAGELYIAEAEGRSVKGLVYSSDIRVSVKNDTFGGPRSHVAYEVDGRYLTEEDRIGGAFCLVTDVGEYQVPFTFSVEMDDSSKILAGLKTPSDFAEIARQNPEYALRLFGYQDFPKAPFMQELHTRTLYDGLRGRQDHRNGMEEFLVALAVKKPVELQIDTTLRTVFVPNQPKEEELEVRCSTWGYVRFTVRADGDFIELPKQSYSLSDFVDGVCRVSYILHPSRLHAGRNLGALTISDVRESQTQRLEVHGMSETGAHVREHERQDISQYLKLRLEYETGQYEKLLMVNQMKQEVERLRKKHGENLINSLMDAELCILEGQKDRAVMLLESRRGEIAEHRQEWYEEYCCYTYLRLLTQEREGQRETLLRLVKRYLKEDPSGGLFALWLKLEPEQREDPVNLLAEMRRLFARGCHSPFMYLEALKIYLKDRHLLQRMDELELQVMMFGARQDMVDHEMALMIAELAGAKKHFHRLCLRLLMMLYKKYEEKPFLAAVCGMLIRGDCSGSEYFPWYEKALSEGISLTRLYEYYLYALPEDYARLLPKEVLLYFSYARSLDDYSRTVLYTNIIRYLKPDSQIYKQYERDIEQFTMDQLLKSRVNRRLVVLYRHVIYQEMIDEKVARVLPSILRSYRVRLKNPNMKYVVVCYEELQEENAFPVRDGVAYVPVFLEHGLMLFQDEYGNRYANIPHRKVPTMEREDIWELEDQCYKIYPDHPMLRMQECEEIMETGPECREDAAMLRRVVDSLPLRPLYRQKIISRMIGFHHARIGEKRGDGDVGYLTGLDLSRLDRSDRVAACETLIGQEYYGEAWGMIRKYGYEGISNEYLLTVCSKMIHLQSDENEWMLSLAGRLFSQGIHDGVLLDYLCEHFNGSSDQMYRMLKQGVQEHVGLYDMPERLLAQMLFTGDSKVIDQVFDWYISSGGSEKKAVDSLERAYFTLRSVDYFLKGHPASDLMFLRLEQFVRSQTGLERVPTIYLLALCRYYAALKTLDDERQKLCREIVDLLLEEGRVFAWMQDLGRLIPMPESVMERVILEYHCSQDTEPEIRIRILPEEDAFHPDKMNRVYAGIYVMRKVLFYGETLEYQITERTEDEAPPVKTGRLTGMAAKDPVKNGSGGSRFNVLNEMARCYAAKDEAALKDKMKQYMTDYAAMEELFPLM